MWAASLTSVLGTRRLCHPRINPALERREARGELLSAESGQATRTGACEVELRAERELRGERREQRAAQCQAPRAASERQERALRVRARAQSESWVRELSACARARADTRPRPTLRAVLCACTVCNASAMPCLVLH
eukprot:591678-Rhodomonas_salina.1